MRRFWASRLQRLASIIATLPACACGSLSFALRSGHTKLLGFLSPVPENLHTHVDVIRHETLGEDWFSPQRDRRLFSRRVASPTTRWQNIIQAAEKRCTLTHEMWRPPFLFCCALAPPNVHPVEFQPINCCRVLESTLNRLINKPNSVCLTKVASSFSVLSISIT